MANLAQLVNVIAPIRSEPDGPAWRQTTFHPFALTARFATGDVVAARVYSDLAHTADYGDVPLLDAVALADGDETTLSLVNRSTTEPLEVAVDVDGAPVASVLHQRTLGVPDGGSRHSSNSQSEPDAVLPLDLGIVTVDDGAARVVLPRPVVVDRPPGDSPNRTDHLDPWDRQCLTSASATPTFCSTGSRSASSPGPCTTSACTPITGPIASTRRS